MHVHNVYVTCGCPNIIAVILSCICLTSSPVLHYIMGRSDNFTDLTMAVNRVYIIYAWQLFERMHGNCVSVCMATA